jgi:enediyne polyketide synthase
MAQLDDRRQSPPGVDTWVRAFTLELVEAVAFSRNGGREPGAPGDWRVFATKDHPLAARLRAAFKAAGGRGVAVCLPENPGVECIYQLLEAGRAVLIPGAAPHFVVIQHGWGGGGFARTLHLENPGVAACVVNVPASHGRAARAHRIAAATGHHTHHRGYRRAAVL